MEEGKHEIYNLLKSAGIKLGRMYGKETNFDFNELNKSCYSEICSILVLDDTNMPFNKDTDKRNELLKVKVFFSQIL